MTNKEIQFMLHELSMSYWTRWDKDDKFEALVWDIGNISKGTCIIYYPKAERWFVCSTTSGRYITTEQLFNKLTLGHY